MFVLRSYAKLNTFLKIVSRRADGYHNLLSLFVFISLYDTIIIKENREGMPSLEIEGKYGQKIDSFGNGLQSNTIVRALEEMHKRYLMPVGLDIILKKDIPTAAGMGGGSSNAGTIINFCNQYFGLNLSKEELMDIAHTIGADVPFFVQTHSSICEGTGNIITPLKFEENPFLPSNLYAILIVPRFELRTPEMYKALAKEAPSTKSTEVKMIKDQVFLANSFKEVLQNTSKTENHFFPIAVKMRPEIEEIVRFMSQHGTISTGMSGSGPACFAICQSEEEGKELATNASVKFPLCDVFLTKVFASIPEEKIQQRSKPCLENVFFSSLDDDDWFKIT